MIMLAIVNMLDFESVDRERTESCRERRARSSQGTLLASLLHDARNLHARRDIELADEDGTSPLRLGSLG